MADEQRLHDLLDLVEQARAEGDADTEQKAIQAYRQESSGTSTPTEAPRPSNGNLQNIGRMGASVLEGAYRGLAEGPGQAVSAIGQAGMDAYNGAQVDRPFQAPDKADILPRYNRAVEDQRASRGGAVPGGFQEGAVFAGEMGAGLIGPKTQAPEATLKILQTMGRNIKSGIKAGTLGSATSYQEGADTVGTKALWTAGGGVLGAGMGVIPSIGSGIQTAFRKYLLANPISGVAADAADAQALIPGLAGKLNAAQETGNASVQKFLNKSAGKYAQEQLLSQTENVQRHLESLDKLYGPVLSAEEIVTQGQKAIVKQLGHMGAVRKRMWDADLAAMRTKVTADTFAQAGTDGTAQTSIALPGLKEGFSQITNDFVNSGGDALTPGFQKILDEYKTFNGHLSFDSLEHLLRLTSGNSGSILKGMSNPEAQQAAGAQLKRTVFGAIDKMDDQSDIGAMLKQMRSGYAQRSAEMDNLAQSAAAKALNVEQRTLVADPEAALDKLLDLDPGQLAKVKPIFAELAPDVLSGMRSANIRKAYQEASVPNAKPGTQSWDIDKFLKATVKNGQLRAAGLYNDAEQEALTKNVVALRVLLQKTANAADTPDVAGTAMAATTLSPAFVVRALYRLTGQDNVDKILFDPASFNKFKELNTMYQSQKWDQAAYLINRMSAEASQLAQPMPSE